MREAIGGTWIFTIVIVFIVLFTSYLAISVNYSKAFKVKNGIVSIIENNEGLTSDAQEEVENYLQNIGYNVYGSCDTDMSDQGGSVEYKKGCLVSATATSAKNRYKYCISKTRVRDNTLDKSYYKVTVFFRLDLPVLGNIFTFPVTGETKVIYFAQDSGTGCN